MVCQFKRKNAQNPLRYPKIKYKRKNELDKIFTLEDSETTCRQTIDIDTKKTMATIQKTKLGSLEYYSPQTAFDFRIGASIENRVPEPPNDDVIDLIRKKERISFQFDAFPLDLTKVSQYDNPGKEITEAILSKTEQHYQIFASRETYEVEMEIIDTKYLKQQRDLLMSNKPHYFGHLVAKFYDHAVSLSRIASSNVTPEDCKKRKPAAQKRRHEGGHPQRKRAHH